MREGKGGREVEEGKRGEGVPECPKPELASLEGTGGDGIARCLKS